MRIESYSCANETINIPCPESYKDCIELIRSDYFRHKGKTASLLIMYITGGRSFRYSFWLRMCSRKGCLFYPSILILKRLSYKYGLLIPHCTKIGYGFVISHCMSVVINPKAVIGNNCNISQFTTIGSNGENAPVIGDEVYIAPQVSIVGDVSIGSRSTIGAGSVIVKSLPSDITAAGVPAKVISTKNHLEYIRRKWKIKV